MSAYEIGRAQAESRMVAAQGDEVFVVLKDLRVFRLVRPIKMIDTIWRLKRVVDALLGTQQFLATEHKGNTLRGKDSRLCQEVETNELILSDIRNAGFEAIHQTHVVVTRDIAYHLDRFLCPWFFAVVDLLHLHLRMTDGTNDAKLQRLLFRNATQPAGLGVVGERTAQGVANFVGEGSNARHLGDIGLHTQQFVRIGTRACTPALAIDEDGGVDVVNHPANLVHSLDIVNAHQVEAETIDMVFVYPVLYRLKHKAAHHGLFGGRLVATAGAVAVARR